jgi:tetratricopeptide (TPR) repeat protein
VYLLALLLFALGLMAKPMLVTLPAILGLLDFWPLCRFRLPLSGQPKSLLIRLVIEKIPFVALTVLSCWVTFYVQNSTGAVKLQALLPVTQRFMHVPAAYGWYVLKLFWPANLSVYYLVWSDDLVNIMVGIVLLLGLTALALWWARKRPWFIVGWLWFVGMLVPVIGIVQVGNQAYADRYTYLPYIGLFIILAWGIPNLLAKWPLPTRNLILSGGVAVIAVACFWRTEIEVHYWKDGLNLFNRAIAVDPKDEFLWMLLGLEYEDRGNYDKDIECLTRATVLNDNFYLAWQNLGRMLELKGDDAGSIDAYQKAEQRTFYKGDKIKIYNSVGDVLAKTGQYDQAIASYQSSLELSPGQADIQFKLAQAYGEEGQVGPAIDGYEKILQTHPDNRETQLNLAMLLGSSGRDAEAIPHYQKVIELDTNVVIALNNLAWMLATDSDPRLRNGKAAVPLAEHACERTHYQEAFLIGTLAAAYAEAGRYDDAVVAAQKARDVALAQGQKDIAQTNAKLMKLYQSGKPFHQVPQGDAVTK